MNLFLIVSRFQKPSLTRAVAELQAMREIYPLLDPSTLASFGSERLYAMVMHTAAQAAAPRRYSFQNEDQFTFFDGCPVDPSGQVAAHDAASLARHWDSLHERLEGMFFAARLDLLKQRLELLSDPLGKHRSYCWQEGEQFVLSNSVRLVSRLSGAHGVDPVGASLFVGMGYVGGDRTLVEGVKIFPDAERWDWRQGERTPRRRAYFPVAELARQAQVSLTPATTARVADALGEPLAALTTTFGPLECPITAGRDSRILVALMLHRGLGATYFSAGEDDHPDVRVGSEIARAFGLPHSQPGRGDDVVGRWQEASRRIIRQNDGLVTLAHIQNTLSEPTTLEELKVQLYGGGGEYARGKWLSEGFLLAPQTCSSVEQYLYRKLNRNASLVRPEVTEVVHAHVRDQIEQLLEVGFALKDLPCAYFYHDYGRRWGGVNSQQLLPRKDVFGAYYTRAYIRAAFSLPPAERLSERLTLELTRHLSPELLAIGYDSPWKSQTTSRLYLNFLLSLPKTMLDKAQRRARRSLLSGTPAPKTGRTLQRQYWLEQKLPELRSSALDNPRSPMWAFVDRTAFERLTGPGTPASARSAKIPGLFLALTLLEYGALQEREPLG